MTAYRAEVLRLREEYAGRMDVLLGIELDNLADVTAEGLDYWIGSAHHMRDREGGWHAVDWDRETLERCFREDFSGRSRMMAESYYDEVRRMAERTEIPVYLALVPSAAEVWREKLPAGAESWDQAAFISRAAELEGVEPVDVLGALRARAEEDIFYRTDHHWTTLGAYYGYAVLMEALGRGEEVLEPEAAKERDLPVSNGFQGTLYSQSGIHWLEPDSIEFWVEDRGLSVISWRDGAPEETGLYDSDYLGEKDKYSAFLGGSQPLCVIRNEAGTGRLMLVRDSYADSLAPFLARHFEEVHLLDLRYYRGSPAAYAQEHGADGIVVLQSVPNLITDRNLALLSQ